MYAINDIHMYMSPVPSASDIHHGKFLVNDKICSPKARCNAWRLSTDSTHASTKFVIRFSWNVIHKPPQHQMYNSLRGLMYHYVEILALTSYKGGTASFCNKNLFKW